MIDLFAKNFESVFHGPEAVPTIRRLVLELAMRGRLVEQDHTDQPAQELLEAIRSQRAIAGQNQKSRRRVVNPSPQKYDLPDSWIWVRFGDVAIHNSGKTLDKNRNTGALHSYLTTSNVYWGRFDLSNLRQMNIEDHELERCTVRRNDLLICEGGEAGRSAVWDSDQEMCIQNHVHRARFFAGVSPYFAYWFFEKLNATGEISEFRKGVGITNMSGRTLAEIPMPLPPVEEQERIVAKITSLMGLCEQLEKRQARREELSYELSALALIDDTNAAVTSKPRQNLLTDYFSDFYTSAASIDLLRERVKDLALTGQLVAQVPSDPSAASLLAKIRASKEDRSSSISDSTDGSSGKRVEARPHPIPQSWVWTDLDSVSLGSDSGWSPQCLTQPRRNNDWGVLKVSAVTWGKYNSSENKALPPGLDPRPECEVKAGDFLISRANTEDLVARSVVVEKTPPNLMMSDKIVRFDLSPLVDKRFINIAHSSRHVRAYYASKATGTSLSMKNVSRATMKRVQIPLPPLPEQHRIVEEYARLMKQCDHLQNRLEDMYRFQREVLQCALSIV